MKSFSSRFQKQFTVGSWVRVTRGARFVIECVPVSVSVIYDLHFCWNCGPKQTVAPITPWGETPNQRDAHTPITSLSSSVLFWFSYSCCVLLIHHCSPQFTLSYFSYALYVLLRWGAFPHRPIVLNRLPVTCMVMNVQWLQKNLDT